MGKIIIKGLRIFAFHGVNAEEKENGQYFEIDLTAQANMDKAFLSDKIEDTVSYSAVVKTVKRIMCAGSDNLLERVAYRIAEGVLLEFPSIEDITLTLKKPDAPMKSDFDYVGIEVCFKRSDIFGEDEQETEYTFAPPEASKNDNISFFTFR